MRSSLYASRPFCERSDIRVGVAWICDPIIDVLIMSCIAPQALLLGPRIVLEDVAEALFTFDKGSYCETSGGSGLSG